MNIGGNNLGFADVIKRCTGIPVASGDCEPPASDDAQNMILTGAGTDRPDQTGLDDVPRSTTSWPVASTAAPPAASSFPGFPTTSS